MAEVGKIYEAMAAIQREVEPIAKDRKNAQQGYAFRGIDDVYATVNRVMAKHGVFMTSEIVSADTSERKSNSGGTLFCRALRIRYRFIANDGSSVASEVMGEGFDSGDKAAPKAMSVAQKYAILQAFMIPTSEPKDVENDDHDVLPQAIKPTPPAAPPAPPTAPVNPVEKAANPNGPKCPECDNGTRVKIDPKTALRYWECVKCGCTQQIEEPAEIPTESVPIPASEQAYDAKAEAIKLGEEIMRRVKGDKDVARELLLEITKNDNPKKGKPFPGFSSVAGMKHEWQIEGAWKRLREHKVFGDEMQSEDKEVGF